MRIRKVLVGVAVTVLGGLVPIVAGASAAQAAGPDLAITAVQVDSPTSGVSTRVTITVANVGDAASGPATVTATASGSGQAYSLVAHPGWTCSGLPLSEGCTHAAVAAGGSASALSVDLTLTNGPVTFVVTVTSAGDCCSANNSTTIVVQPRAMVVSGTVWSDDNGNGRQDSGEAALGDVKLQAFVAGTSTLVATEWTFGDKYRLILPDAAPSLTIVVDPANEQGRYPTTPDVGPGDALDSDFAADRKFTLAFTAGAILDLDAGLLPKGVSPSPVVPESASPSAGSSLPKTGVSLAPMVGVAALLIAAGVLLLLLRRRRSDVA